MVAVEQPRADCGHAAVVTQQCGKCLRWCCPECYAPWTALACGACRAEARAAAAAKAYAADAAGPHVRACLDPEPAADARCRDRSRGSAGARRRRDPADVPTLAARVAALQP